MNCEFINPRIIFTEGAKYLVKINSFSHIFDLYRKILPCFKRKQEKICGKNRGFVDSEFVKTFHEHVNVDEQTLILLNNAISGFAKKKKR